MMNVTAVKGISLKLVSTAFFFQKPTSFCVVRQSKKKTDSRPRGKSVFFNRIHMEKPNLKNALNTNMAMKMKNAPHYSKCDNFEKKNSQKMWSGTGGTRDACCACKKKHEPRLQGEAGK